MTFLERFNAIVAELRAHPDVEVFEVHLGEPASESTLQAIEAELNAPIPPALRAFYLAHDGAFLEWGLRGKNYPHLTAPFNYPDDHQPPACINLLPARDTFSSEWEDNCDVNTIEDELWERLYGEVPEIEAPYSAVVLDNYSKYHYADLILGPEPLVLVSSDHGADMETSDFVDCATYLDMTLALYGLCRYKAGLGIGRSGDPRPRKSWSDARRLNAWTERPSLDALIQKLRDDYQVPRA